MHAYTKLVKKFLNGYMAETREQRGMSKEEMSERLRIEPRSYADLEKERYCLSAPSLMFFLLFLESPAVSSRHPERPAGAVLRRISGDCAHRGGA